MSILQGKGIGFRGRPAFWPLAGLCLLLLVGMVACQTEEDRIRRANEAAREVRSPVSRDRSATVDVIEFRDGDCFTSPTTVDESGQQVRFESFDVVPCTQEWGYRVINSFVVQEEGTFPGYDYFTDHALRQCQPPTSICLPPSVRTWNLGDRRALCVEER